MSNLALKSLWNKALIVDEKVLSTEAKPARESRERSRLVAVTSRAANALGRESSAAFSHREHLFKNLHTVSTAEGSPKCVFVIRAITDINATETKLGGPVQHRAEIPAVVPEESNGEHWWPSSPSCCVPGSSSLNCFNGSSIQHAKYSLVWEQGCSQKHPSLQAPG